MATHKSYCIIRTALFGLLFGALTACGNKGDLKPPGSEAPEPETASARLETGAESQA